MSELLVATTYGAFLLGGLFAFGLSGIVNVQTYIYFKLYPDDDRYLRYMVLAVWITDLFHTGCICAGLWRNVVVHFGDPTAIDSIPWPVALTVTCTGIITLLVHCFFAHRIYKFSHHNWWIIGPILFLNLVRFGSAMTTSVEMLRYGRFTVFKEHVRWLATLGLSLSSGVDILVTSALWYYLHQSRTRSLTLNRVIDLLLTYAFETVSLTCATTTIAMICWVTLPQNLVFMGFHFLIAKLFANSFLLTLNARLQLRMTGMSATLPTAIQFEHEKGSENTKSSSVPESSVPSLSSRLKAPGLSSAPIPEETEITIIPSRGTTLV